MSKGNPLRKGFLLLHKEEPSLTEGWIFSLQILYQNQRETSSESLTKGQNYHFHLFFNGEEPSLTEGPNELHYNYHTSNQCNSSSPSLTEGQSEWVILPPHNDVLH